MNLAQLWTDMWNGELDLAERILAPDFRVHFGAVITEVDTDSLRGPTQMREYMADFREDKPGIRFALHGDPVVAGDQVVLRWDVELPGAQRKSGIDWLTVTSGVITEVWSVTGARDFVASSVR